jgi:SAM-dependent methyltransferase
VQGVDTSSAELAAARRDFGSDGRLRFSSIDEHAPSGDMDLVYTNGVFHHIPPAERAGAVRYIRDALRPGGWLAFWENNPWNPGTRYVMSRIPFDRDAITLSAPAARRLLVAGGFEVHSVRFCFIFPRSLRALRPIEPSLSRLPLGGQYQVLCRKPA